MLDGEAKADIVSGAFVVRHHEWYWNAVSGDQFGEQTDIKIGKGSLKGTTLSAELVCEWIDAFPVTVHVSDRVGHIYFDNHPGQFAPKQHKEDLRHQRVMIDADDRRIIDADVEKYPHPLEDHRPHLYNPVTGKIASAVFNVVDSMVI